jgi:isoquinoline 1-oxidoreductase
MLYARILRPPAHGAKLKNVDTTAAEKMEGVRVVKDGDLVAVLHALPDVAEKALSAVRAEFETPEAKVDEANLFAHLLRSAPPGQVVAQGGDLEEGRKQASVTFDATYLNRYVAHAPIEPHSALAKIEGGKVTVWASTQRPFGARDEVARALGLSPKEVRVLTPFVGGGFGGKTRGRQIVEAARLAKITGKPVQVAWTREEEFFYDTFRPAAIVQIRTGLDGASRLAFWDYRVLFAGDRGARSFYDVAHHRTTSVGGWSGAAHPFETGAWRAPGSNTNTFARESQIDILAAKAGMDPLAFRLAHLSDPRMRRVVTEAARRFRWRAAPAPSGKGQGLACGDYLGTHVAAMAEVEVDGESGAVRVKRIVCAQDMGQVVNPEGAKMQVEGGLMMGLGYALTEEVHFRGGEIRDRNFDTYQIPRFSWLPRIEAVLIDNPDLPPSGGGEPSITCAGAVVANAIFDAIGARLFELPMTPERVKRALAASGKTG